MAHITIADIVDVVRRRKLLFIVPFLSICFLSIFGAVVLPRRYEAYTTILFKKEQTLNPLLDFQRAVMSINDNQLASFNEIVYSRRTVQALLDSLHRTSGEPGGSQLDELVESTRKKIITDLRGNDSFRISFMDSDPVACQQAASALCSIYIETSLQAERQQAATTVEFLTQQVEELRAAYEASQGELLASQKSGVAIVPLREDGLQQELGAVRSDIVDKERELEKQGRALKQLKMFQQNIDNQTVISQITVLSPEGGTLSYVDTLKSAAMRYNQLLSRYKSRFPQVESARTELASLLERSTDALEARMKQTQAARSSLSKSRNKIQASLSKSVDQGIVGSAKKSEFERIKANFEAAKQKLDQATTAKALTDNGASKYVILDPAEVPSTPTKPNIPLVIGGGFFFALITGIAAMFIGEYFDPIIRRRQDIEIFSKPIIAYLP